MPKQNIKNLIGLFQVQKYFQKGQNKRLRDSFEKKKSFKSHWEVSLKFIPIRKKQNTQIRNKNEISK